MSKKIERERKNGIAVYHPTQVAPAESTGGAGVLFEAQMQSLFAVLMICNGELSFAPRRKIIKIQHQVRNKGFCLDDWRIELVDDVGRYSQALIQAKRKLEFYKSCSDFTDSIQAAWLDYNNNKFNKATDKLIIVTGPLRRSDADTLEWLVERARRTSAETLKDELLNRSGIGSAKLRIYELLRDIVRVQKEDATDLEIIEFVRHLYLFCPDICTNDGMVTSFAISLIKENFPACDAVGIYSRIEKEVSQTNSLGGETIASDLITRLELADTRKVIMQDSQLAPITLKTTKYVEAETKKHGLRKDHQALLSLIGAWSDAVGEDKEIICDMLAISTDQLEDLMQAMSQSDPPLASRESGISRIIQRRSLWKKTASYVSKDEIVRFVSIAEGLLGQEDKSLNVSPDSRYLFPQSKNGLTGTNLIREGIIQGLAIFASDREYAKQLTFDDCARIPLEFARNILSGKDWRIWATLDNLLPVLAEISPEEYLRQVSAFVGREEQLSNLFGQEYRGLFGRTYILGLVNSLGILAWFPECMPKSMLILGAMAAKDPDGQWHPRPVDFFQRVFHPVAPHTWTPSKKRVQIFSGLVKNLDDKVAWDATISLLPSRPLSFMKEADGPLYHTNGRSLEPSKNADKKMFDWEFEQYCNVAIELCGHNSERLCELVHMALEWPSDNAFERFTGHLVTVAKKLNYESRYTVWRSIQKKLDYVRLADEHNKKVNWENQRLKKYLELERAFTPRDVRYRARVLFGWERLTQAKDVSLNVKLQAIRTIFNRYGFEGVFGFATKVDRPENIGEILAKLSDEQIDLCICPKRLSLKRSNTYCVISAYVSERFATIGWGWVDKVMDTTTTIEQKVSLLVDLPFGPDVWSRLKKYLGDKEAIYWQNVAHPYVSNVSEMESAVNGLLSAKCAYKAVDLLAHYIRLNHLVDAQLCCRALNVLMTNSLDSPTSSTCHNLPYVIKQIQSDPEISLDDKAEIEWKFIDLVDWVGGYSFRPTALESKLATMPELFVKALEVVFLPEKGTEAARKKIAQKTKTVEEERRDSNVWSLLHHWHMVPGVNSSGVFDANKFNAWVKKAFALAKKTNHLTMAKATLGSVFIYAPHDTDGFWIPRAIARLMQENGNETMLSHYRIALYNSRGAHSVDKTGEEDHNLAAKYMSMAEAAEAEGFFSLGNEMRALAQLILDDFARMDENDKQRERYYDFRRDARKEGG